MNIFITLTHQTKDFHHVYHHYIKILFNQMSFSDIIMKILRSPITLTIISKKTGKIHPATLYTLKYAGATHILALGGIQVSSWL